MSEYNLRSHRILALAILIAALFVGGLAGSWATAKAGWSPFGTTEAAPTWVSSSASADVGRQVSFVNGFVPVVKQVLRAQASLSTMLRPAVRLRKPACAVAM